MRERDSGTLAKAAHGAWASRLLLAAVVGIGGAATMAGMAAAASRPQASTGTNGTPGQSGGGALAVNAGTVTLTNAILWNDAAATNAEIFNAAATVSAGASIIAGGCPAGATCTGTITSDPLLGTLANHGGPTQTMLPDAGSPAIDAVPCVGAPASDQRGVTRPQGSQCDIGAVEVKQFALSVVVTGNGSVSADAVPAAQSGGVAACTSAGGANCAAFYRGEGASAPANVNLTATIPPGQGIEWGGDCATAGVSATASVSMSQARNCTVTFAVFATTTALSSNNNPSTFGQNVTFTATVTPQAPLTTAPTGTVAFLDGGTPISGCAALSLSASAPYQATCSTGTLGAGNHPITAQYSGDANYQLAAQPVSNTLAQVVNQLGQTITFTSTPPANPVVGATYTPTATGGGSGNAVTFSVDPASTTGACSITGSTVTFTGPGTCIVDANQAGNANFSAAPQVQQVIVVSAVSVPVPLLDRWALVLLGALFAFVAIMRMHRA